VLLGMVFLSLAVTISVYASDRGRASGAAIALWFFFVLVYDLLLLGGLVVTGGRYGAEVFPYLLLLNPADVYRVLNIFTLEDVRTLYGLATVFPAQLANPVLLGTVMLAWIIAPLALASWRFRK
jgi:Cu-processing system permease protein